MEWLKVKLYGKVRAYNNVYYKSKAPTPKKGWLRKSDLMLGDLWFSTSDVPPTAHVWSDGRWKRLGID